VLGFFPKGRSMSMRAQSELLHLLTGAAPFDPGRESRVLSSEMETSDIVSRPPGG
jgi:hypothetical protein